MDDRTASPIVEKGLKRKVLMWNMQRLNKRGQQEIVGGTASPIVEKKYGKNAPLKDLPRLPKRGQQEIVGFVLIVVLVMIALMVFLVISARNASEASDFDSVEVRHMLDAMMLYTTDCAIVFEPQYDSVEDLFKSAYEGDHCSNLDLLAEDYLNDTLTEVLEALVQGEATILGYELTFSERDGEGVSGLIEPIIGGDCAQSTLRQSAQRNLVSGGSTLIIRLQLCRG